jgi:pumilio homology domain family member 6
MMIPSHHPPALPPHQKRRTRLERSKTKPAFNITTRAKEIWNVFRVRKLDKAEKERLAAELFELIHGKLVQLAMKHDAARVVRPFAPVPWAQMT